MRCGSRLIGLALLLCADAAFAQTPGNVSPGVDIWSTLLPKPPSSTATQPAAPYSTQAAVSTAAPPTQPSGVPVGSFILYPMVTAGAFYDDNVFALNTNRLGDWAYMVRPEIALRSNNWSNAQIAASAFVEQRWYQRFNSEDQFNAAAALGGTLQPDADTQIVGKFVYLHAHEDRGTSDSINTAFANPLAYDQFEAAGAINKRFDRVWASLGASGAWIHFQDGTLAGTTISQAYRNGTVVRVPLRVGYVVAPLTSVFGEVSGHWRDFSVDAFDSSGYRAVGGVLFEPGPGSRIKGEFFVGYMRQNYNGGFQTVSTITYGSSLAFLVASNLTAVFEGRRDAKEASLSGGIIPGDGVSVIETLASLRADILIMPNVVVGAGVSYLVDEYLLANRTDRSWSPLFSAKWFVNPHLTLAFDYRHLNFDSSGLGVLGYGRNVYLVSAHLKI